MYIYIRIHTYIYIHVHAYRATVATTNVTAPMQSMCCSVLQRVALCCRAHTPLLTPHYNAAHDTARQKKKMQDTAALCSVRM